MVILYFFLFWYVVPRKIWQPCVYIYISWNSSWTQKLRGQIRVPTRKNLSEKITRKNELNSSILWHLQNDFNPQSSRVLSENFLSPSFLCRPSVRQYRQMWLLQIWVYMFSPWITAETDSSNRPQVGLFLRHSSVERYLATAIGGLSTLKVIFAVLLNMKLKARSHSWNTFNESHYFVESVTFDKSLFSLSSKVTLSLKVSKFWTIDF
jgi:hypothetical protein